jgi:hypothetical protein
MNKICSNPSDKQFRNKAEQYYVQAITTFNKNKGSMLNKSNLSYAAINLANLYTEFNQDKAMQYAQLANKVSLKRVMLFILLLHLEFWQSCHTE